ncbi:transcription factor Adf-1-like [Schistocerca cancellata]|uniref:transcription factor Adf-1-like n=1 Tax=Schistocerca cancellata TaxID=274614 RepID=UPI0021178C19|nr:transcription factor Adf-1-like [Schistocerca cancellata]
MLHTALVIMDVEQLINEVKLRPAIWDQRLGEYHNRDVISSLWNEVAQECCSDVKTAKSKWKHLRDNYRAELKKLGNVRSGDPGKSPQKRNTTWPWFQHMHFLRDILIPRAMQSSLSSETEPESQSQLSPEFSSNDHSSPQDERDQSDISSLVAVDETSPLASTVSQRKKKRSSGPNIEEEFLKLEKDKLAVMKAHQDMTQNDDTYHFLMSLRSAINSLPVQRQMFVKLKIQELVYNELEAVSAVPGSSKQ